MVPAAVVQERCAATRAAGPASRNGRKDGAHHRVHYVEAVTANASGIYRGTGAAARRRAAVYSQHGVAEGASGRAAAGTAPVVR